MKLTTAFSGKKFLYLGATILFVTAMLVLGSGNLVSAQSPSQTSGELSDQCFAESSYVAYSEQSGLLSFVGTYSDLPIKNISGITSATSSEQAGRGYLSICGPLFGLSSQAEELQLKRQNQLEDGRSVLHFQQTYKNIPVFAGELNLQLNTANDVIMVMGEILPNIGLNTSPSVSVDDAQQAALNAVTEEYQLSDVNSENGGSSLTLSEPELWIYDPQLIGEPNSPTVLVWRMEVSQDIFPPSTDRGTQ